MFLAYNQRVKDTRCTAKGVYSRIDTKLGDLTAQLRSGIQVREGGGRSRVGQVVGRHIDGLHRSDRPLLGGGDSFLHGTHL